MWELYSILQQTWPPITLGHENKGQSFHKWAARWLPHRCLPATHRLSPRKSRRSPWTCQACCWLRALARPVPAAWGTLSVPSPLPRLDLSSSERLPNYSFKNELSNPPLFSPSFHAIFIVLTISWHSMGVRFLACCYLPAVECKLQEGGAVGHCWTPSLWHCAWSTGVTSTHEEPGFWSWMAHP